VWGARGWSWGRPDGGNAAGLAGLPLLANIALHTLDERWAHGGRSLGVLVRYADDLVVLCRSQSGAEHARHRVATFLSPLRLQLNPEKTRIVCLTRGRQGLDFLGFHLRKVESWRRRGRFYLLLWPSAQAMASIRSKIREATDRRFVGLPMETVVARINPILRGWVNDLRVGNSARKLHQIDSYVHERLAIFASTKHGLDGRHWASRFNYQWYRSLGVHRPGTIRRYELAHARR
jgi:hypothetical protein